jgi:hypothetical protein
MFLGTEPVTWLRVGLLLAASSAIGLVWYGWWTLRRLGVVYAVVGAVLFATAQIVLSELALGLSGLLYAGGLIAFNLAISALVFFIGVWPHRKEILEFHIALRETWRSRPKSAAVAFLVALFLGITVWNLLWGWFLPPREWDVLNYHLTIMAAFYQSHSVFPIPSPIYWVRTYPINGELVQLWVLAAVGVDKVVDWAFVPSIIGGAVAVYGLGRRLGAKPAAAVFGACVMAFAPRMLLQQTDMMNDALFAAWAAMALYMILGIPVSDDGERRRQIRWSALGAAAGAGLAAGLKFAGIAYALGLIILFFIRWFLIRPKTVPAPASRSEKMSRALTFVPALLLFLGLCVYPYIRNWILNGNPVAPYIVQVDGLVLFPGSRELSEFAESNTASTEQSMGVIERTLYSWFEPYQSVHDLSLGGLGALWIILGVPALIAWVVLSLRRRKVLEIALVVVLLAGGLVTPAFWYPRYILPVLILGSVATAVVLDGLGRWPRRLVAAEIIFLSLFSVFNSLAPKSVSWQDAREVVLVENDRTRSGPQFVHPDYGQAAYDWIDRFTLDRPAVITYGDNVYFPYLLYGPDIRNRVIHLLPNSEGDWRASLVNAHVELILVRSDSSAYAWTKDLPTFREVYRDGLYVVLERV